MAQRLGAGASGQLLAATATACAPVLLVIFGFYSMNAIEILIWSACCLLLIEILVFDHPRHWLTFGLVAGLGVLNKHTFVLLVGGLGLGLLLTRQRRQLASRWLWGGAALALLLALPSVLWQLENDWVSLEFYRNAAGKNLATPPFQALVTQVLSLNPGSLPIWTVGAYALLRDRTTRPLGILFALLFLFSVMSGQSRQDRIAGLVPLIFAAGAAYWDRIAFHSRTPRKPLRVALFALPLAIAAALSPVVLPILPAAQLARYAAALGVVPQIEDNTTALALPQWFADRVGWEAFAREIEAVYADLPEVDKSRTIILTRNYGGAGALQRLGRDLPPVHSVHNSYHTWGPPDPFDVAITVRISKGDLLRHFESVTLVSEIECAYCRQFRTPAPIYVARGPEVSFGEVWSELGRYY